MKTRMRKGIMYAVMAAGLLCASASCQKKAASSPDAESADVSKTVPETDSSAEVQKTPEAQSDAPQIPDKVRWMEPDYLIDLQGPMDENSLKSAFKAAGIEDWIVLDRTVSLNDISVYAISNTSSYEAMFGVQENGKSQVKVWKIGPSRSDGGGDSCTDTGLCEKGVECNSESFEVSATSLSSIEAVKWMDQDVINIRYTHSSGSGASGVCSTGRDDEPVQKIHEDLTETAIVRGIDVKKGRTLYIYQERTVHSKKLPKMPETSEIISCEMKTDGNHILHKCDNDNDWTSKNIKSGTAVFWKDDLKGVFWK